MREEYRTWKWRRLSKMCGEPNSMERVRIAVYLTWLALCDKGTFAFNSEKRRFIQIDSLPENREQPLIIGDQRDPARSNPWIGRRREDVIRHIGLSGMFTLAIPVSSFVLQSPLTKFAEAMNATRDLRFGLLSLVIMVLAVGLLWTTFSISAVRHAERAAKLIAETTKQRT